MSETLLFGLLVLACPIGMGVMMRGSGQSKPGQSKQQQKELAKLHAEVDELRTSKTAEDGIVHSTWKRKGGINEDR